MIFKEAQQDKPVVSPLPDGKRKNSRNPKKSPTKKRASKKLTPKVNNTLRRKEKRAANKNVRKGKNIAAIVVDAVRALSSTKGVTPNQIGNYLKKKGTATSLFVLNKVLQRLRSQRVVNFAKGRFALTGKPIPKILKAKKAKKSRKTKKNTNKSKKPKKAKIPVKKSRKALKSNKRSVKKTKKVVRKNSPRSFTVKKTLLKASKGVPRNDVEAFERNLLGKLYNSICDRYLSYI
jgi:hypothetical protein